MIWVGSHCGGATLPAQTRFFTWRPQPHESTLTTIRRGTTSGRLATAIVQGLDPTGQPTSLIEIGGTARRETIIQRDGEGEVSSVRNPELLKTSTSRNLAGWPVKVEQQRSRVDATLVESSQYIYDRRGQVLSVVDPKSLVTSLTYNAFGEVSQRTVPGTAPAGFTYDAVGRPATRATAAGTIRYDYEPVHGDQTAEVLLGGTPQNLVTRTFDVLGRLLTTTNYNTALPSSLGTQRQVTTRLAYDAAGRVREDGQRLGGATERTVTSSWSLDGNSRWQRDFTLPQGTQWRENFDSVGRLGTKRRMSGATVLSTSTFDWLGELPDGRSQSQSRLSFFRQKLTHDSFGAPLGWKYTAIDLNGTTPVDAPEGNAYCGGLGPIPWTLSEAS